MQATVLCAMILIGLAVLLAAGAGSAQYPIPDDALVIVSTDSRYTKELDLAQETMAQQMTAMLAANADIVAVELLPDVWRFATDPDDTGIAQQWFALAFDDSNWAQMRSGTGAGWEEQGFPGYDGYAWYRQQFAVPTNLTQQHLYMFFGAVDEDVWIYADGRLVFEHTGESTGLVPNDIWTTPFSFDAHDWLK